MKKFFLTLLAVIVISGLVAAVTVVFYRDEDGCHVLDWIERLPERAYAKGFVRVERLAELGHELRRPEADYLRDGIYELRWRLGSINYRVLYFFHGREAVVLAHGLTKEGKIPNKDIDLAVKRKNLYLEMPDERAHHGELP